jgi:hypothetical protein
VGATWGYGPPEAHGSLNLKVWWHHSTALRAVSLTNRSLEKKFSVEVALQGQIGRAEKGQPIWDFFCWNAIQSAISSGTTKRNMGNIWKGLQKTPIRSHPNSVWNLLEVLTRVAPKGIVDPQMFMSGLRWQVDQNFIRRWGRWSVIDLNERWLQEY